VVYTWWPVSAFKLPFLKSKTKDPAQTEEAAAKPKPVKAIKEKIKKPPPPIKIKPRNVAKGKKFVFYIGDEGVILIYTDKNTVISRQFVPDASEQNLKELSRTLEENLTAPIVLVIDNMDQSYIQQSLPPVSSFSVQKLIKRRLDRDFGKNDIKGAIPLGRDTGGRKDWNFLMIALERSPQLTVWLNFVFDLPNRFQGIYLVSVETELVLKDLERAMGVSKAGTGSKWKFFVSHNKVGGFRQVVMRNGRIIFTRLAQPVGESTPEVIAGNIEQEMITTMEYMKRIGYDAQSGLDIYIVASDSVRAILDKTKFKANHFEIMTPFELAGYLKIEGATQPTDQFGDVILAAAISSSPKHILTLTTPESKRFATLYQGYRAQRAIGVLMTIGLILYAGSVCVDIYSGYSTKGDLEETKVKNQHMLDDVRAEVKRSNFDVDKTGDVIDLYLLLKKKQTAPFDFITKIEQVLKPPIMVKTFDWSLEMGGTDKAPAGKTGGGGKTTAVFTLEFAGVANIETFKVVSQKVLTDMKTLLPGYDVSFTKLPTRFSETEKLDMTFGEQQVETNKASTNDQSSDVQLTIKEK